MQKQNFRLIISQNANFSVLMLLAAGLILSACAKPQGPETSSANPLITATSTSSTMQSAGPIVEVMNARQFVDHASRINKENPIKPEWPYVTVVDTNLNLAAQPVDATSATLVQVPLAPGSYNLKTSALLSPTSQYPVQFSVTLRRGSDQASIFSTDFKPGDTIELDQNFAVPNSQCELLLTVKMEPKAQNHFGATLYLRDFALSKRV